MNYFSKEGIKTFCEIKEREITGRIKYLDHVPSCLCILTNDTPESAKYVKNKVTLAKKLGIKLDVLKIQADGNTNELGIVTSEYDCYFIQEPNNIGGWYLNCKPMNAEDNPDNGIYPCTAKGIMDHLLWSMQREYKEPYGIRMLICGYSPLVGQPLSKLAIDYGFDVTVIRSRHGKLLLSDFDVVIEATGKPSEFEYYYRSVSLKDIIVYDVTTRFVNGVMRGSIPEELKINKPITPVPFGVGQLTLHALMDNIVRCAEINQNTD